LCSFLRIGNISGEKTKRLPNTESIEEATKEVTRESTEEVTGKSTKEVTGE
jgi:hypothetical protein